MKRIAFILPLIAFAGLTLYLVAGLQRDPSRIPSTLINKPIPAFALAAIEGRDRGFSSEDLKGQVALVNVFGSWCVGCRIEHPLLMRIAASGEVPIYGIDWKDKPGAGAEWLARFGDPYQLVGDDSDGRVAIDFGVTGAPETYVIDANGRIRYKHVGPIAETHWRDVLRPMIEELNDEMEGAVRADRGREP